ncbi:urease accessory UreF family protein [Streptomyces sp. NPDC002790]|uniref:urease accessory protein UreF n=1 Tax=Streptomyces sp. NPDC002790 TaxID=3154431 RepID=UPI00332F5DEA
MDLAALVLADGRLPTGGHAQSAGLEPALAAGLTPGLIPDFLAARLDTVGSVDAACTVLSRRAALSSDELGPALARITHEYEARTPSPPMRAASALLGRGMVRLAERLWPHHDPVQALRALPRPPRPVALGVVCALAGLDDIQSARVCLYEDAQTVASAAPKLLPVDPLEPVRWVLDAADVIERAAVRAVAVSSPEDIPATAAPLTELWSLDHAERERRIFHA